MMPIDIINKLIVSTELRYNIKDAIATSLVKGKIKYQWPSLQNILSIYLSKVGEEVIDEDAFIVYLRSGILLIRWLKFKKIISLDKSGRHSPYIVKFSEVDEAVLRNEFYRDKIFFSEDEYNPDKSRILPDLSHIELTPVSLNHDYFAYIK